MTTLRDEIGKRRPFDSIEQEAFLNLVRTASVLGAAFERLFAEHRLSMATYNVLRIVRGETASARAGVPVGGVACQVIGDRLVARGPDVTRLVDRLENLGFAKRIRGTDDRRVVLVAITPRGLEKLARLDEPVRALHREQLRRLSRAELRTLNELLERARASDRDEQ